MKMNDKAGMLPETSKSMGDNSHMKKPDMKKGYSDATPEMPPEYEVVAMMGMIRRKGMGR